MSRFIVVDRIEGKVAVVVDDDGKSFDVPKAQLPQRVREGSVLKVAAGKGGEPDWTTATLDEGERQRRLKVEEEKLKELRRRDPGGDVSI